MKTLRHYESNDAYPFAGRTDNMKASAIREILKVVAQPGMVSLAGGIPAPESFPMSIIRDLTETVFSKYGSAAMQYDHSEGFYPLREALSGYCANKGINAEPEEILTSTGSQGLLDLIGKIFISKGDCVAVEAPTYLGALQAFTAYEPEYVRIETDDHGLIPETLEKILSITQVKFVYLVPTFQNPTGRTLPLERRKEIARIITDHGVLLVEDDPYSDLRYRGISQPAIKTIAPDNVIYVSSLSKIFAPGLRLGFCIAPPAVHSWLVLAKQGVDLHTSTLNQALAAEYLAGGHLEQHLPSIIDLYKPKQEAMLTSLECNFPKSFTWSKPEGGMFIWVEGPKDMDMEPVCRKAVERNVAFVPGKYFFTQQGEGIETMRLNYTMADEKAIDHAIQTLGDIIKIEPD